MTFWPLWLQMTPNRIWADNFCREYLADEHAWVTGPYHVICRKNSILVKITFWPLWPLLDLWPQAGHVTSARSCTCYCDQSWSKLDAACLRYWHVDRRTKKKKNSMENKIMRLPRQDKNIVFITSTGKQYVLLNIYAHIYLKNPSKTFI